MTVSSRHILEQGSALGALGRVAIATIEQQLLGKVAKHAPVTPGPKLSAVYSARSPELIRAYVANVGGDPSAYGNTVPAHFVPQWAFGIASRTLEGVPYPMRKVLNVGC